MRPAREARRNETCNSRVWCPCCARRRRLLALRRALAPWLHFITSLLLLRVSPHCAPVLLEHLCVDPLAWLADRALDPQSAPEPLVQSIADPPE